MKPIAITVALLEEARTFFEQRGSLGCEGTAMIAMSQVTGTTRFVVPDQRAGKAPRCWVEVTERGKLDLAVALGTDETYVARFHSHPMDAFHSATDDSNPALTHDGAISIVAPYFGLGLRHGLETCAVHLRERKVWRQVSGADLHQIVVVR